MPQVCDLNTGGSCALNVAGGGVKTVTLHAWRELTEPYFESAKQAFADAVIAAEADISVDGRKATVVGGPFSLPIQVNGLWVLLSVSRG